MVNALGTYFDFDGDRITVGCYLRKLLEKIWIEEEGFSGKRPFGNSGWQSDLTIPLVAGGFIDGEIIEESPGVFFR